MELQSEIRRRMENRAPWFRFEDGKFYIEDLDYRTLVEEYGTPLVCFSRNRLQENAKHIKESFRNHYEKTKIFYAYKANYFGPILSDLKKYCGAEVISDLELQLARRIGVPNGDIIFNGVGKTNEELESCVENDILVNVDSLSEIDKLDSLAAEYGKKFSIGLRVHPELGKYEEDAFIKSGSKLGLDIKSEAEEAVNSILKKKHLQLKGLHAHSYSRQTQPQMYLYALDSMIDFSKRLEDVFGTQLDFLDIGGGFDTRAVLERTGNIDYFAKEISERLKQLGKDISLYVEPGRYVVNDAGVVITKIITEKSNAGRKWLITDIATNFLIPVKNANFEVIPADLTGRDEEELNFGGGICSSADVVEEKAVLPLVKEGEHAVILNCGAYTSVMSEQFVYPRPRVVYIDKSDVRTLWGEESIEDVIKIYAGDKND